MTADAVPVLPTGDPTAAGLPGSRVATAPDAGPVPIAAGGQTADQNLRSWLYAPPVLALGAFVLVALALAFVHVAAPLLNPLLLSIFLVTLALPVYRWLAARTIKKGLVLVVLLLGMLAIGLGLALLAWLSINRLLDGLEIYAANIEAMVQELGAWLEGLGIEPGAGTHERTAALANTVLVSLLGSFLDVAGQFGIAAVLAAFLLLEARRFRALLETSMRDLPYIGMTPQVMQAAITYFFIRIRLNVLTGAAFGLVLLLLGVDYALLWAVITVVLSFVPYIGLVLAATPATLLALAEFGPARALVVLVAVVVINLTIENVIAPTYTGKTLSLSPAVVFVSFFFWVWLLGPLGALLSMPITVLLMLTFNQYDTTRWLAQVIGDSGPTSG
jgi:predicted PurR-regulated permease PerM